MNRWLAVPALAAILLPAASLSFLAGKAPATIAYDLFIGFNAKRSSPANEPAVTELALEMQVKGLRFVFGKRELEGMTINWYPVLGSGPVPSRPILTWMADGRMKAKVAPLETSCEDRKVACRLTSQQEKFRAVLTVLDVNEDVGEELLDPYVSGNLEEDLPGRRPAVLRVSLLIHGNYAWACDCAATPGDWGQTQTLEFAYALPVYELEKGREVSSEFPLPCDDIDGSGTLTVGLVPSGSIKKR